MSGVFNVRPQAQWGFPRQKEKDYLFHPLEVGGHEYECHQAEAQNGKTRGDGEEGGGGQ